jgi:2-phosphosulfolactate phosphatase
VKYIRYLNPDLVSLVAMGYRATLSADEDLLCAQWISGELKNNNSVSQEKIAALRSTSGSRFFIQENLDFSPPTDFFLCTMLNRFDFVLKASKRSDGNVDLMRIDS